MKRYSSAHQPEVLQEFERLVEMVALDPGALEMAHADEHGEDGGDPIEAESLMAADSVLD